MWPPTQEFPSPRKVVWNRRTNRRNQHSARLCLSFCLHTTHLVRPTSTYCPGSYRNPSPPLSSLMSLRRGPNATKAYLSSSAATGISAAALPCPPTIVCNRSILLFLPPVPPGSVNHGLQRTSVRFAFFISNHNPAAASSVDPPAGIARSQGQLPTYTCVCVSVCVCVGAYVRV